MARKRKFSRSELLSGVVGTGTSARNLAPGINDIFASSRGGVVTNTQQGVDFALQQKTAPANISVPPALARRHAGLPARPPPPPQAAPPVAPAVAGAAARPPLTTVFNGETIPLTAKQRFFLGGAGSAANRAQNRAELAGIADAQIRKRQATERAAEVAEQRAHEVKLGAQKGAAGLAEEQEKTRRGFGVADRRLTGVELQDRTKRFSAQLDADTQVTLEEMGNRSNEDVARIRQETALAKQNIATGQAAESDYASAAADISEKIVLMELDIAEQAELGTPAAIASGRVIREEQENLRFQLTLIEQAQAQSQAAVPGAPIAPGAPDIPQAGTDVAPPPAGPDAAPVVGEADINGDGTVSADEARFNALTTFLKDLGETITPFEKAQANKELKELSDKLGL